MESGAPPNGRTESIQHQGAGPTPNVFGVPSMDPSGLPAEAPPTQSELGAPSASQLGKPQGAPPDQEEIGNSSHCQRLAWIENEIGLQDNPNLRDPVDLKKAQSLLLAYWDVLSKEGEYSQTSLIEQEIKTTPGHPIKNRIRPLNPTLETDLRKQIDKWQSEGVIKPSMSPWNFGLVAAPKKSGTIRWCVDFRGLNQRSIVDSHPLPNIEDNLSRLSRSCVYSTLDGAGAYHVVPIKKQDREKTAFGTLSGSYQFKRMPFGLCNAPATYCRLVQMVLQGIPYSMAFSYLDDTCVHSRNLAEHFIALQTVLEAFRKAGLKLQPKKCFPLQKQGRILGTHGE
jgi:hypothetical protein